MKTSSYFTKKYLENRPAFMSIIRSQEANLFQECLSYFRSPCLDFGCGDGFFAGLIFGKKKITVGLDVKNSRIREAKKTRSYKKIVIYDGKKIPFTNNYFSTVISNCVFEHLPKLNLSLKEIHRVLKPGGFLITTVMTDNWNKNLFGRKIFGKKYIYFMKKKQQHINLLSEKRWASKFKKNSFVIVKKTGYLNSKQSQKLDLWHYLSLPALISYKLFGKWVVAPRLTRNIFFSQVKTILSDKVDNNHPSAIFFILQKKAA